MATTTTPLESGQLEGFVSYCREDTLAAKELVQRAGAMGRTLWLDTANLPPATEWRDELRRAIESADAVVCLLSPGWLASVECRRELELAQQFGKRLVPVRIEPVSYDALPQGLRALQWIDARTSSFDEVTQRVLSAIDDDHRRVREHTRWLERAARWEERERDRSLLARGRDLRVAEEWLSRAGEDPHPAQLQMEYVAASRRAERRRGRTLLSAISMAAIVALLLAGLAVWQRGVAVQERNTAESRRLAAESQRLAAESQAELAVDPEIALILAANAWRTAPTTQARTALRQAVSTSYVRSTVRGAVGADAASFVPGLVVTAGADGEGTSLEAHRGKAVVSRLDVGAPVEALIRDASGGVGIAMTDTAAVGWALERSRLVQKFRARDVMDAAVSQSGDVWAVLDGKGQVFTASPGSPRWERAPDLVGLSEPYMIRLSADGRTLAVGDGERFVVRRSSGSARVVTMPNSPYFWVSGDGRFLIGLAGDGPGRIVRVEDGAVIERLSDAMTAAVSTGQYVAIHGEHGVDIYRLGTPDIRQLTRQDLNLSSLMTKSAWEVSDQEWTDFSGVSFDASGLLLLTWEAAGVPQVWDVRDGQLLGEFPGGRRSALSDAGFVAGGTDIATWYEDSTLRFWDVPDRPVGVGVPRLRATHGDSFGMASTMVLDPERELVTMAGGGWIGTWSTQSGKDVCASDASGDFGELCAAQRAALAKFRAVGVAAVSPSPDWRRLAVVDGRGGLAMFSMDREPRQLWHLSDESGLGPDLTDPIRWSPDGHTLLHYREGLSVVDAETGRATVLEDPDEASPQDGLWISEGREIGVWVDPEVLEIYSPTGRRVRVLPDGTGSVIMESSPGDEWIAVAPVAARGNVVKLVDVVDGSTEQQLWGADDLVSALAVSRGGQFVAAGDEGGGISIWEADTGSRIGSSTVPGARDGGRTVVSLAFAGDGAELVAGASDGTLWRMPCPSCRDGDSLAEMARGLVTLPIAEDQAEEFGLTADQLRG